MRLVLEPSSFFSYNRTDRTPPHPYTLLRRTPNAKLPAMLTDMLVQTLNAFPKQLYVRRKTHITLIAGDIGHAHVKVLKVGFPV